MFWRKLLPPSQKAARETEDMDIWKTGKELGLQTTRWEKVDLKDVSRYSSGHICTAAQLACDAGSPLPLLFHMPLSLSLLFR